MRIDAVVLAGGDAAKVIPSCAGPKSLIRIGDRSMIGYVMNALRQCPELDSIVIALPADTDESAFSDLGAKIVTDTHGVVDAIDKAINMLGEEGFVLVVSSDAPMISPEAINELLATCRRESADIYYTIVAKDKIEAVFPGTRRTYARLRDGIYTGGNVHLTSKNAFRKNKTTGERLFDERKNPIGLLRILGPVFIIKFIFGRLTIESLEKKVGGLLSSKTKAVITDHAELGVDVDKPEDLKIAEDYLLKKKLYQN